jgi:ornithine--oxo-acid transaminase
LIEQAQKVTISLHPFYDSVFGRFTQRITKMFGYEMVLPLTTGAEAIEASTKLARKWAYTQKGVPDGKAIVFTVSHNFHGRTLCAIRYENTLQCVMSLILHDSMSTNPTNRIGFEPFLQGVGPTFVDGNETRTIRFGVIEDLERALELYGKHVAAFLVEPIQGIAG